MNTQDYLYQQRIDRDNAARQADAARQREVAARSYQRQRMADIRAKGNEDVARIERMSGPSSVQTATPKVDQLPAGHQPIVSEHTRYQASSAASSSSNFIGNAIVCIGLAIWLYATVYLWHAQHGQDVTSFIVCGIEAILGFGVAFALARSPLFWVVALVAACVHFH